jgi:ATP-dependent Lon protease
MPLMSAESTVAHHIDCTSISWQKKTKSHIDINKAEQISMRPLRSDKPACGSEHSRSVPGQEDHGPISSAGRPVWQDSICRSIARHGPAVCPSVPPAVRDEAEIRGHRTISGDACKIIQSVHGSMSPTGILSR